MASYNLGEARGKIVLETDFGGLKEGQTALDNVKSSAEGAAQAQGQAWGKVGTQATVAGATIVGAFALAAGAASRFESTLSGIQAVSGATSGEMDQISAAALRIGRDTAYSAVEAAQAMEELSKAGVSTSDILNGAADATVALAAAGEIALPEAAAIAANAMNQFSLKAEDLVNVTDKIAGAANASAIDVSDFGQSMTQVGAVANLVGLSFDDTALAITAMGNAGIKGGDAGTSLKSMLLKLNPATQEATDLMTQLGIITEDGVNQFYDAEGSIKSLADVSGVLSGSLEGMTDAQKQAALTTLFGTDAIRAAAVVAQTGTEGFNALSESMNSTSAADVAAARLDNMAGSTTILMGSLETMMIVIGQKIIPVLTDMVRGITEGVNAFTAMDEGTQGAILAAIGIAGALLLAFGATVKITQGIQASIATFKALAIAENASKIATKARAAATVIAATATKAASAATAAFTGIQKAAAVAVWLMQPANAAMAASMLVAKGAQLASAAATGIATAAQWAFNAALTANPIGLIIAAIVALVAGLIWFFTQTELGQDIVKNVVQFITEAWENVANFLTTVWEGIVAVASDVWNGILDVVGAVIAWFQTYVLPIIQFVIDAIVAYFTMYYNVVMAVWNGIMAVVAAVVDWFMTHVVPVIAAVIGFIVALFNFFWGVVQLVWQAIWDFLVTVVSAIVDAVIAYFTFWYDTISSILKAIWDFIVGVWNGIVAAVTPIVEGMVNFIIGLWENFQRGWDIIWNAVKRTIDTIWNAIKGFLEPIVKGIVDFITNTWSGIVSFVTDTFNNVKDAIMNPIKDALAFIGTIKDQIIGFFSGAGDWLYNAGKDIIDGFISGLEDMLGNVGDFFSGLTNMIPEIKGPPAKDKVLLTENGRLIMQSLANGLAAEMGEVYGLLDGMNTSIPTHIQQDIDANWRGNASAAGAPPVVLNLEYHAAEGDGTKTKEDVIAMLGHATELVREELS